MEETSYLEMKENCKKIGSVMDSPISPQDEMETDAFMKIKDNRNEIASFPTAAVQFDSLNFSYIYVEIVNSKP
jgi:hypothetical protein